MKVDPQLTVVKPLSAKWIISLFDCLHQEIEIVRGRVDSYTCRSWDTLNEAESEAEACDSETDPFEG